MTFLQQLEDSKDLWQVVAPQIEMPSEYTFVRWLNEFGYERYEQAVRRLPWRFQKELSHQEIVLPEKAHRFITSTLVGLRQRQNRSHGERRNTWEN